MNAFATQMFLVSFVANLALGDGIPVDRKTHEVNVPHTDLDLTKSQTEEIETMGTLTFTSDQWQELRAVGSMCPKRIETVLPVTWSDCTCGVMGPYAIQITPTKVAITHDQISGENLTFAPEFKQASDVMLRVDRRGQFIHQGILVPFAALLELVANSPDERPEKLKSSQKRSLYVELPLGIKRDSPTVKSRLDQLFATARGAGWRTQDEPPGN